MQNTTINVKYNRCQKQPFKLNTTTVKHNHLSQIQLLSNTTIYAKYNRGQTQPFMPNTTVAKYNI